MIDRYCDGITADCRSESKVSLGLVEGFSNRSQPAPAAALTASMESGPGKPVVHHIPAQSWEIQKRLHVRERFNGYGRLIAELPNSIRYLLSPQPPRRKEIER